MKEIPQEDHVVRFGIGRIVCLTCNWDFSIPFNRSMSVEKVLAAYQRHLGIDISGPTTEPKISL